MIGWHHQLNGHEFEQALGNDISQEYWSRLPFISLILSPTLAAGFFPSDPSVQFSSVQSLSRV